jgi:LacI family transcriptional regulator, repressor for deo operon, udp, cdd, tsx, nupC, and nupG
VMIEIINKTRLNDAHDIILPIQLIERQST